MKSSSLHLAIKHGIDSPQAYRDSIIHDWYLKPELAKKLEVFLLRRLESWMLFKMLKDGEVTVGKKQFSIVWIDPPAKLREQNKDVLISLRYCPLLKCGYALIKDLKGEIDCEYLSTPETEALETERKD